MSKPADTETWLGIQKLAKPLVTAGIVLGVGLGGFFDGIVLHQILQWHNMVSSYPDPSVANDLRLNVMADGFFHGVTYLFTLLGITLLMRAWRLSFVPASRRTLFGAAIIGWGLFNFVEGIVDHHLLAIHHVWPAGPGPVVLWDVAFLVWGLLFIGGGYAIIRGDDAVSPVPTREGPEREREREQAS
ncbi:DUF2243 domain-containing protein [Halomontanus rarus]|uniref:DUF2243 domain-containing protein n=1 Tax=Halomontanus rarus TaxID=3034020 RepID=UPI001A994ED9